MIEGSFSDTSPSVQGRVFLPRLGLSGYIDFLVDTGADTTTIHPPDADLLNLDYGVLDLAEQPIFGIGGVNYVHEEPAVISFQDRRVVYSYSIIITIPQATEYNDEFPSLLGQDIIQNWRMVHDTPMDRLTFTVQKADFRTRGDINDIQIVES